MKQGKQYCLSTPNPVVSLSAGKTSSVPLFFMCFASHSLPNVREPDTWGQNSTLRKLKDRKKTSLRFLILCRLLKFTCNKALQEKKRLEAEKSSLEGVTERQETLQKGQFITYSWNYYQELVMDLLQQHQWAELCLAWVFCCWSVYAIFPKTEGWFYVRLPMTSTELLWQLIFHFFFPLIDLKVYDSQELCISLCPSNPLLL